MRRRLIFLLPGTLLSIWATAAFSFAMDMEKCAPYKNPFDRISCYAAAAKEINDLAPCDNASQEGVRYQCYAIFAEYSASPEVCHKIPQNTDEHLSLIDACLSDVAMKVRNPGLCESIKTPGLRDSCYLKLAMELGEGALCAKIQDVGLKSACTGEPVIVE
jgi:hypothetical protein